ncbi:MULTISPECIES: flavodoxin [unclassified Pseudoalteromonas]|uniref:flavodoxin n=1 Tax=unclassified Pseudoalteromonas TaxID=194690 RepID=UPI0025B629AE|nr:MULTISPECIES: flavodoxin [unclassified Pseudoalteromonas]MDN3380025.1 flavodoxin [Pseudoalteromonas sp. APC 3893]MDN3388364.1 flavodoxin [Pseudoalteromonas sp. APC 4017]
MATISIFVGSVYGGAERLSDDVIELIEQSNHQAKLIITPTLDDVKSASHILVITSTTGQGEIPDNLAPLYSQLNSQFPMLAGKPYGIVAMGDRSYGDTFCGAGRSFDELFRDLQAKPIGHRLEIDACEDFEPWPVTEPWLKLWLTKLPE